MLTGEVTSAVKEKVFDCLNVKMKVLCYTTLRYAALLQNVDHYLPHDTV
jgi:hypothetical protein